jgi:hypothetical protein
MEFILNSASETDDQCYKPFNVLQYVSNITLVFGTTQWVFFRNISDGVLLIQGGATRNGNALFAGENLFRTYTIDHSHAPRGNDQ